MKKKKILLIILPIILILVIGVTLGILYFMTDIFKSNSTLFAKYFLQNEEILDIINNPNIKEQSDFKANNTYTMTGDLTTTIQDGTNSQGIKAVTEARHDTNTGRTYSEVTLKNGKMDALKVSYINSEDVYAVKCDDIMANYIGFRNSDLKKFAQNMGVTDTKNIPDNIDFDEIAKIANITEEQRKHIIDTYSKVILDSISEESYTKMNKTDIFIEDTSYETNVYQVTINEATLKQIMLNCLTTLKDDNNTLVVISNTLTSLGITNDMTDITKLSEEVGKLATQMQNTEINDIDVIITVYENKGKTVRTELTVNIKEKQEIESMTNTIPQETEIVSSTQKLKTSKIVIDRVETMNTLKAIMTTEQNETNGATGMETGEMGTDTSTTQISQIILEKSQSDASITNEITIIPDTNNMAQSIVITTTLGNVTNNVINNASIITLNKSTDGINIQTIQSSYIQSMQAATEIEEILELKNSNTVIVNNYTSAQLIPFLTKIGEKTSQVLPNKLSQLGIDLSTNQNSNMNVTNITSLSNDLIKMIQIIGTSGLSIVSANGVDVPKTITTAGIGLGISIYNQSSKLVDRVNDTTQQLENQTTRENQTLQNTITQMDSIIE